jgi:hypothetical protein
MVELIHVTLAGLFLSGVMEGEGEFSGGYLLSEACSSVRGTPGWLQGHQPSPAFEFAFSRKQPHKFIPEHPG